MNSKFLAMHMFLLAGVEICLIKLHNSFDPISQSINIVLEIWVILSVPCIYQIIINYDLSA